MAGTAVDPVLLSRRDLDALCWGGAQYAVRADQLGALLACNPRTMQRLVARLRERHFVEVRRLLVGEPAWVIPTVKGLRAAGLSFGAWRPRLGSLAHVLAVTEVRLYIQSRSSQAEWVCERTLAREKQTPQEHLADAVVLLDGRALLLRARSTPADLRTRHREQLAVARPPRASHPLRRNVALSQLLAEAEG